MRNITLFLIILFSEYVISSVSKVLLNTEMLLVDSYADKLSKNQIEKLLESQEEWLWLGYIIVPLFILLRINLVSLCLSIGVFFYDAENKIKFKKFFRVALLGEFVLVFVGVFKFLYFYLIQTNYTLVDIQQYYPLSYTNFLDVASLEPWLVYPLQTINLFEIGYIFVLVYGMHKLLKNKYAKSFEMVAVSYGTGLVIWLGLVMFLTLNLT